jgi:3-hydroxyacyl-[acyl-carrier-protein] dehydratase
MKFVEEKTTFSIQEILACLPHRYPFLLIDRVLEYKAGESLTALKNVTVNEPFFTGHFPEQPVMPGVLILEALAQAAAILAYKSANLNPNTSLFYLASVDDVRYKQMVIPGDQLILQVRLAGKKQHFWKVEATASVDNKVVCQAKIMSAKKDLDKDLEP